MLVLTLTAFVIAMAALWAHVPLVLACGVVLWGTAYGAAPTLLQTALITASGTAGADVATAWQTTVYNAGIAAGSLAGGIILGQGGAGFLPLWGAVLAAVALVTVLALHSGG